MKMTGGAGLRKAIAFLILGGGLIFYIVFIRGRIVVAPLPYFGPREAVTVTENGAQRVDTVYHTIPEFRFINQDGETVTHAHLRGKIYVADFFFTSCRGICLTMAEQMKRAQDAFPGRDNLLFLSHTVDPERDSAATLKRYAEEKGAEPGRWIFLTGGKRELYELGEKGYFMSVMKGDPSKDEDDFLHDRNFLLIDGQRRIRGIYDGTDPKETDRLIHEIGVLLEEHEEKKSEAGSQKSEK